MPGQRVAPPDDYDAAVNLDPLCLKRIIVVDPAVVDEYGRAISRAGGGVGMVRGNDASCPSGFGEGEGGGSGVGKGCGE